MIKSYLIILIIFKTVLVKERYYLQKINIQSSNEPFIFDLLSKGISNVITLTFIFSYQNNSEIKKNIMSFGYYDLFYHYINIYNIDETSSNNIVRLNSNTNNISLLENNYYYFILEVEKIMIPSTLDYKIKTTLDLGQESNLDNISIFSEIIESGKDFDSYFINIGNIEPEDLANFNFSIENLIYYNRKLTTLEKNNILLDSIPLIFLDFSSSLSYSQYFHNKLENDFMGGINGNSINGDKFDLFYEYIRVSTNQIRKRLYIINNRMYIKLSQEIIKFLSNFGIDSYTVYLKSTIHLNNSNVLIINNNYKLYNRENKSGININLIKINENSLKKFEFKINLIENSSNFETILSNNETLNIDYFILRYKKKLNENKFEIFLNFKIGVNKYNLEFIQINNNFLSTDNHYIGDNLGTKYSTNYILIEIEEFMLGKGLDIKNLSSNTNDIIYDRINLFCLSWTNNKINRINNLYDNCTQRNEIINITSNCEYFENSNCIFNLPDFNPDITYSFLGITLNYTVEFYKPNKQIFKNTPNSRSIKNKIKPSGSNLYNFSPTFYTINANNIIIYININNTDILNNIIEIEFNNIKYSDFVINKNYSKTEFAIEIKNSSVITNPILKIINLSGNNQFTINSIFIVEIRSNQIITNNKKMIGEKINNYYKLVENKLYVLDSNTNENFRIIDNILIKCHPTCTNCNGPNNLNCINCKNDYSKYNNIGCTIKNGQKCLTYGTNPSFCLECWNNYEKIIIDDNRVKCLCHPNCKTCTSSRINSCTECFLDKILYINNECKTLYPHLICNPNFVLKSETTSSKRKCLKCDEGCNSCLLSDLMYCNDCLYGYILFNNKCIRCDEDGRFKNNNIKDSNNQPICSLCHSDCKKCFSNSNVNCISCHDNYYLLNLDNNLKECSICNTNGYYKEGLFCNKCDNNCLNCINDSKNCISCKSDYLLDNIKNDCVINCRLGTYKNGNNCFKCHHNCISCNNESQFSCIECINNLYLDHNTNECLLCNKINNIIINKKCYNCYENCRSCDGINNNNCLSCKNDLYLYEKLKTCIEICPIRTYELKIDNLNYCRDCFEGCLKCNDFKENSCLSCDNNLYYNKYTKTCKSICEKGYFLLNNECEKCDLNCNNCIDKNKCIECENKYYLKEDKFWSLCKDEGYYKSKKNCLKCNSNCLNCIDYDNCLNCNKSNLKIYNKIIKKHYCIKNCKRDKFFNKIMNKCIDCNECNNCQIKNDYLCQKCDKCKKKCEFDYKFNETGLFFNNKNNQFKLNTTLIKKENIDFINYINNKKEMYFFNIKDNNDNLKVIEFKLSSLSFLKNNKCTFKTKNTFKINKIYNKICGIKKIDYNIDKNLLFIKFNFKIKKNIIKEFIYKIKNNKIKYEIKNNITYSNDYEINFNFIPNYFKKKFNITFIFDNNIIKELNCEKQNKIMKDFLIFTKNIFYKSETDLNLNELKKTLDPNSTIVKNLESAKPIIKTTSKGTWGTTFLGSLFSQFLSLLVRFFQVVYILDFIQLLKINLGEYTNSFLSSIKLDIKLYFELNSFLNLKYSQMEKKINRIIYLNPKLRDSEFIYLTNFSIEFIILIILFSFEIFSKFILYFVKIKIKKNKVENIKNLKKIKVEKTVTTIYGKNNMIFKARNNKIKNTIKINKKKNMYLKYIKLTLIKIKSLKIVYIGTIFPNLVSSVLIYSEVFNNFEFTNIDDLKLIVIFLMQYCLLVSYIHEILIALLHFKLYGEQKTNYEYRENFFLFDNSYNGFHNYIILFSIIRDTFLIFIGILVNINIIVQIVLFLIVQIIYFILIINIKSKYDYKNIKLFKIQEFINLILFIDTFILYFTKFELFQFIFIFSYIFLLFISVINLFVEVLRIVYYKIIILYLFIKYQFKSKFIK